MYSKYKYIDIVLTDSNENENHHINTLIYNLKFMRFILIERIVLVK